MSNRSTDAIDESIGTEASFVVLGSIVSAEGGANSIKLGITTLVVPAEDRSGRVQGWDVGREASPADSAGEVGDDGIVNLDSQYPPDESAADISWSADTFLPPAEPAPKTQARYRLQLNAEQRRQLEGLDLSRPVPVPGRRDLTRRVISIVLVANDLASRGIPVCAATVRAGLVALGWCTEDKGNQALGDVLGRWGLDLSH